MHFNIVSNLGVTVKDSGFSIDELGGPLNLCKTFRKPLARPHVRWYNI